MVDGWSDLSIVNGQKLGWQRKIPCNLVIFMFKWQVPTLALAKLELAEIKKKKKKNNFRRT